MDAGQKTDFLGVVQEPEELVVVALYIEEPHRLGVVAKLRPRQHLEHLLEGAIPAGQNDKGIGQMRHHRLPRVHALDDKEFAQPLVRNLVGPKSFGNDPNNLAPRHQGGIGDGPHEPDLRAPVNDPNSPLGQQLPDRDGRFRILGAIPVMRPTKNGNPPKCTHGVQLRRQAHRMQAPDTTPDPGPSGRVTKPTEYPRGGRHRVWATIHRGDSWSNDDRRRRSGTRAQL